MAQPASNFHSNLNWKSSFSIFIAVDWKNKKKNSKQEPRKNKNMNMKNVPATKARTPKMNNDETTVERSTAIALTQKALKNTQKNN